VRKVNGLENLREFIESSDYENAISEICKSTRISIYSIYNDVLLKLDNDKLEKSGIKVEKLKELLECDYTRIIKYAINKLVKFHGVKEVQEYPEGKSLKMMRRVM
jgi:hypothetical protein